MTFRLILALIVSCLACGAGQISEAPAKPECYDVFYGKKDRIYLTGEWKYKKILCKHDDYFKVAKANEKLASTKDSADWGEILVPNYMDTRYNRPQDSGATFLRRNFNIADLKKDKRYILKFQGLAWEPIIYINGKKAVEYKNILPGYPTENFQTDITDFLKEGDNSITVSLFINVRQNRLLASGIYAPVFIDVVNPVYASKMLIQPRLPDKANIKLVFDNTSGKKVDADILIEVSPWKGKGSSSSFNAGRRLLKPGRNKFEFNVTIKNPVQWNLENPFLYSVKVKVNKKLAGFERFGLREFKVKGKNFYLNGNKINCYGMAAEEGNICRLMYVESYNPQFIFNSRGVLRKYIRMLKANNCSVGMRWPCFSKAMNDICDEEGFINIHMLTPFKMYKDMPLWIKKQIVAKGKDIPEILSHGFFCKIVDGKMKRYGKEIFNAKARNEHIRQAYIKVGEAICNNPSVVGILNGDENFRSCNQAFDMPLMRKSLYEVCPGLVFAGEHGIGATSVNLDGKRLPVVPDQDFVNYAGANCGGAAMNVCHFSLYPYTLKWRYEAYNKNVYPKPLPSFADEALYYGILRTCMAKRLWSWTLKDYSPMYKDGKVVKSEMIKLFKKPDIEKVTSFESRGKRIAFIRKETKGHWWTFRKTIKLAGLQVNALDKQVLYAFVARRIKKMVEITRMYDQYMQGACAVSGPWFNYDMTKMSKLDLAGIESTTPIAKTFKLVYSPLFTCISLYDNRHSFFAGDDFKTKLFVFNNTAFDSRDVKVAVTVSQNGKEYFRKTIGFGNLKAGAKMSKEINIPVSSELQTGNCKIDLKMLSENKLLLDNDYEVFVLSKADAKPQTSFKGTLYVLEGQNNTMNKNLAELLGNIQGLKVEYINDLSKLNSIKYLILAPRVIKKYNEKELSKLNAWLKNGGKMLVLAQRKLGKFPWMPEVKNVPLVGKFAKYFTLIGIDMMPVDIKHPAFDKLGNRHYWNTFNNKYGEVYRTLMAPLDMDAVAIGADVGQGEYSRCFGSLLIEKKVGKGTCVMSQAEAVKALSKRDAVAAKYLINMLMHLTNN